MLWGAEGGRRRVSREQDQGSPHTTFQKQPRAASGRVWREDGAQPANGFECECVRPAAEPEELGSGAFWSPGGRSGGGADFTEQTPTDARRATLLWLQNNPRR